MAFKKTVCVDLDATLATYDGWKGSDHIGEPRPGTAEFMQALKRLDLNVVVFTTRTKVEMEDRFLDRQQAFKEIGRSLTDEEFAEFLAEKVEKWLRNNYIPFDEVYRGQGKPIASAYVDDRAVAIRSNPEPVDFTAAVEAVKKLL